MSTILNMSESEEVHCDGPLLVVVVLVVEGDDSYTVMIQSLLFLADCHNAI
jgi:hypothetical protein